MGVRGGEEVEEASGLWAVKVDAVVAEEDYSCVVCRE